MPKSLFLSALVLAGLSLWGGHNDDEERPGEYYEFDVEGSPSDQLKRKIKHGVYYGVKAPFMGLCFGFCVTKKAGVMIFHPFALLARRIHKDTHIKRSLKNGDDDEDCQIIVGLEQMKRP